MYVEQAIFTSAQTDRTDGYQLVARSSGINDDDARELSAWGPSHDSLHDSTVVATSVNVYPLPSGATCVSRSSNAGCEYSGRSGFRVYTQCFVIPDEVMRRFAYQPFAILNAAAIDGRVEVHRSVPKSVVGFRLLGRASPVDRRAVEYVVATIGADRLAALADLSLDGQSLGIIRRISAEKLFSAINSCLPLDQRQSISFTTGLRFSTQRPFRWICLPGNDYELRQVGRLSRLRIVDPTSDDLACLVPERDYFPVLEALLRERDYGGIEDLVDPKHRTMRSRHAISADSSSAV